MKILRWLILLTCLGFLTILAPLPNNCSDGICSFADIEPANFHHLAKARWQQGHSAQAVLLLNDAVEKNLPGAATCEGAREGYLTAMSKDQTFGGRIALWGLQNSFTHTGEFKKLSLETIADRFIPENVPGMEAEDEIGLLVQDAKKLTNLVPSAAPALRLTAAVLRSGILTDHLSRQIKLALQNAANSPEDAATVAIAQESVLPLYQLAKQCHTWGELSVIAGQADSFAQLKLLIRMVSLEPFNADKLARALIVAETSGNRGLPAGLLDYVLSYGQSGIEALDFAQRRGVEGIEFLLKNPSSSATTLAAAKATLWPPAFCRALWTKLTAKSAKGALFLKGCLIALLSVSALLCLMPCKRKKNLSTASTGDAATPSFSQGTRLTLLILAGIVISLFLTFVIGGSVAHSAATQPTVLKGSLSGEIQEGGSNVKDSSNLLSWALIALAIVILQGTCWILARRKIKGIAEQTNADTALKLRQLENLDIFFDLPLYTGLALTILAFILISILGAGVSRFLAYASTFVGILFTVALRLRYLYPLREKLIIESEE